MQLITATLVRPCRL